jgi:hypothetical protein
MCGTLSSEEDVDQALNPDAFAVAIGFSLGVLVSLGGLFWYRSVLLKRHQADIAELEHVHQQEVTELTEARMKELEKIHLETWLQRLQEPAWRADAPEVEMEAKFVFPLLRHLGYSDEHLSMRVPVAMQKGSSETRGEADWVAWKNHNEAIVVVEAKAPRVPLKQSVIRQARSYAIRLEAPVYIVTNGEEIRVFQRGVIKDHCVLMCITENLHAEWESLEAVASRTSVLALRERLLKEDDSTK